MRLSVLDLVPVRTDQTTSDALAATVALAQAADRLGFTRYWVAEHHNMPSVGATSPPVLLAYLAAQTSQVQDVSTGAVTYGHRFLTTSGRAGRAIKVRSFDEYRARLLENFVILERAERHNKIARELDAKAQRLQGRVSRTVNHESGLLLEVPDLVEYPSVVAGTFALEFLELPEEVLTTTLIHHQHYFPVEGDEGVVGVDGLALVGREEGRGVVARDTEGGLREIVGAE